MPVFIVVGDGSATGLFTTAGLVVVDEPAPLPTSDLPTEEDTDCCVPQQLSADTAHIDAGAGSRPGCAALSASLHGSTSDSPAAEAAQGHSPPTCGPNFLVPSPSPDSPSTMLPEGSIPLQPNSPLETCSSPPLDLLLLHNSGTNSPPVLAEGESNLSLQDAGPNSGLTPLPLPDGGSDSVPASPPLPPHSAPDSVSPLPASDTSLMHEDGSG